jgi:hypothetical protein
MHGSPKMATGQNPNSLLSVTFQVRPKPGLIHFPIAVLLTVQQHHGKPVPKLRAQRRICDRGLINIGDDERDPELLGQGRQFPLRSFAGRAPRARQQR